jgi:hypothetical protein
MYVETDVADIGQACEIRTASEIRTPRSLRAKRSGCQSLSVRENTIQTRCGPGIHLPDVDQLRPRPVAVDRRCSTSPEEKSSEQVTRFVRQRGWTNVRILKGRLGGWPNARLAVESKRDPPAALG